MTVSSRIRGSGHRDLLAPASGSPPSSGFGAARGLAHWLWAHGELWFRNFWNFRVARRIPKQALPAASPTSLSLSLFFSLTHVLFVALVSLRHSFSSSCSPSLPRFPCPPPSLPLSPRKEKIQTLTNKISAIPSEGELRQEPRISWKKRQREPRASLV